MMAAIIASITMIAISTAFTKSAPLGGLLMANSICKHNVSPCYLDRYLFGFDLIESAYLFRYGFI